MKRRIVWGALLLLLLGMASAGAAEPSVIVAMGVTSEPAAGFDPIYGWGAGEHVHEPLIQSTLTVTTRELEIAFDLATELVVSEDGLLWTASLREDVFFTDGAPLTASDVAFTYNMAKEQSSVSDFTMLEHAEAADDHTVLFHMTRPYAIWPYTLATLGIVPEHAYGPDYGQNPVGSGRYILRQWDKGQQAILEANPDYYGEAPSMRRVIVVFMEEDAAFAAVLSGQVDIAYTAALYAEQEIPGYALLSVESVDNRGLNLPAVPANGSVGNDITADPALRRALNKGIDRQALIDRVLGGHGSPAYSVCDKMPWASPEAEVAYDPEGAMALLEEAGWIPGEDGVRAKEGLRASLTLLYPAGDSLRQGLAAETANQLALLGIEASIEGVGWDVAYDRAQREIMTWGWGAHTPMELYNIYHSDAQTGLARYSPYFNEAVDAAMDAALAAGSLEESYALWRQAQEAVQADMPWIWLVNIDHLYWAEEGLQVAEQKIHPHGHGWSLVNNVDLWTWSAG